MPATDSAGRPTPARPAYPPSLLPRSFAHPAHTLLGTATGGIITNRRSKTPPAIFALQGLASTSRSRARTRVRCVWDGLSRLRCDPTRHPTPTPLLAHCTVTRRKRRASGGHRGRSRPPDNPTGAGGGGGSVHTTHARAVCVPPIARLAPCVSRPSYRGGPSVSWSIPPDTCSLFGSLHRFATHLQRAPTPRHSLGWGERPLHGSTLSV